jgi:CheY-like chemotaxis protein
MDIHMPVMDGLEAASQISALGVKTPIVALTANIMVNDLELYEKSGMKDFLGKPFVSQELWKCLIKYLPVAGYTAADQSQMSDEEEKLQKQLKLKFVRNNQTIFADIVKASGDGDSKLAHRLAHTLKSNAGQIGEKALQNAAAQVEASLSEGKARLNENQLRTLEAELKSVLDSLAPLLAEDEAKKTTETAGAEKIRAIIEELEPLLINRNPACEDLLDDIHTIPGAEELARQIEKFKFKQAHLELRNLKKTLGIE